MTFAELTKSWALASLAGDHEHALVAVREAMRVCVDASMMESLLIAEAETLARMRGEAFDRSCAFCGHNVERRQLALVGLQVICQECAAAAGATLRGVLAEGWSVIRSATPGADALELRCEFCRCALRERIELARCGSSYICGVCVETAGKAAAGNPCGRTSA